MERKARGDDFSPDQPGNCPHASRVPAGTSVSPWVGDTVLVAVEKLCKAKRAERCQGRHVENSR